MPYLILDISTAAIDGADQFVETGSAPANYKDPEKIAAYIEEKKQEAINRCALDPDLGRITGIGWTGEDGTPCVTLCKNEETERAALIEITDQYLYRDARCSLIGYNAQKFDWPFLVRRARYLGVALSINTDRYKSPHIDLLEILTQRGQLTARSLGFYIKRLGWTDLVKPLTGQEEAQVLVTDRWDDLAVSLKHDVTAIARLAHWLGVADLRVNLAEAVA